MSDSEDRAGPSSGGAGDEEVSLPRATVYKLIAEMLPGDFSVAKETKDLIMEACTEFIRLVSSEANDLCEKSGKRTIGSDHCVQALKDLGFESYLKDIDTVLEEHKAELKYREKKNSKMAMAGLTDEELQKQQEALFAASRARFEAQG
ncbi:histone-fold-containing protein [Jaminaea rosea]|uniref:Histone-fold-containing protein n=1 Tax=Jaminaea rosea TaxID=1569628 RepID=A0A316V1K2_9BASI|nr:histone-fold-containing protein [Jaminaea rosea]PWN30431.1 histone-fold-containing protein [Jaminaea rosea]